jgi:hypothetical protein
VQTQNQQSYQSGRGAIANPLDLQALRLAEERWLKLMT